MVRELLRTRFGWLAIGAAAGILVLLAQVGWTTLQRPPVYNGTLIEPALPAADFELPSSHGGTFRLSEERGRVVLLFFGFTSCPDVCPATMSEFRRVLTGLEADASQVLPVFISVDPERDTLDKVSAYTAGFDPAIVGLTGSDDQLKPVWDDYGVFVQKHETGNKNYSIDHTSRVYVVDKQGNLRLTYSFGESADAMLEDIRHLLQEKDA